MNADFLRMTCQEYITQFNENNQPTIGTAVWSDSAQKGIIRYIYSLTNGIIWEGLQQVNRPVSMVSQQVSEVFTQCINKCVHEYIIINHYYSSVEYFSF